MRNQYSRSWRSSKSYNLLDMPAWRCSRLLGSCSRSEEHTSELQSHVNLVCRLLLEKKKKNFFGAPHIAIIHTTEPLGTYGAIYCGAYFCNLLLSAHELGLAPLSQASRARQFGAVRR